MLWGKPPMIKIYEALGAVADGRVEIIPMAEVKPPPWEGAKVWSSSRNKFYEITYDPAENAIMANDNGSYWKGYLGYPAIAYLMIIGTLSYEDEIGELLKGIAWKDINTKFKNDFDKVVAEILASKSKEDREKIESFVEKVAKEISELKLRHLGKKKFPPDGY